MRLCGFFALYLVAVEVQTAFTDRADLVLLMVAGLTGKVRIVVLAVGDMRCRGITGLYRIAVGVQKTATDRAEAERYIDAAPTGQKVRVMELAAAGVRTVSSDPLHRCTVYINRVSAVHANIEVRLESAITGGVICRVLLSAGRMRLFCGRIRIQPRAILVHNSATCDTMVMWNLKPAIAGSKVRTLLVAQIRNVLLFAAAAAVGGTDMYMRVAIFVTGCAAVDAQIVVVAVAAGLVVPVGRIQRCQVRLVQTGAGCRGTDG